MTKYLVISSILLFFFTGETRAPVPAKSQNIDLKLNAGSHMDKDLKDWFDRADSSTGLLFPF